MIWLNGALCPAGIACIDPADRGLLLGDGLFETIAVRGGAACDVGRHFTRLADCAAVLRITVPFDAAVLAQALAAVIAANALIDGGLRLTLTRGAGARGLLPPSPGTPTVLITAFPLPPVGAGVAVVIARSVRRDEDSPLSALKTLNYLPNILARIEAAERGADDAILLNRAGRVAEATIGNVFVHISGAWVTPPVEDGALPGIRRAKLIEAGKLREARISGADIDAATGICIGNVLSLRRVTRLGNREVPGADISGLVI